MVTYYRDPDVLVTSGGVRIGGRDYRLGEFVRVWHERGRRQDAHHADRADDVDRGGERGAGDRRAWNGDVRVLDAVGGNRRGLGR